MLVEVCVEGRPRSKGKWVSTLLPPARVCPLVDNYLVIPGLRKTKLFTRLKRFKYL